eukprot:CAMPEP_0201281704 /NCGR_PEP_ID=MMETSP1317-20130820/3822_1 /ASSEMBLY_ACC=CAM_ASM_000770 /TAXON_ID=187299 /ORGANISM="Undescribed Undescribed, Strain Undescribed" /LENGTH=41 /DNA_ID= /DNA_START= /DNA_END= /DNA_ORIENTATION=
MEDVSGSASIVSSLIYEEESVEVSGNVELMDQEDPANEEGS